MRMSAWSADVCSSDLLRLASRSGRATRRRHLQDEVHRHAGRLLFEAAFAVVIEQFGLEGHVGQVAARTRAILRRLLGIAENADARTGWQVRLLRTAGGKPEAGQD